MDKKMQSALVHVQEVLAHLKSEMGMKLLIEYRLSLF